MRLKPPPLSVRGIGTVSGELIAEGERFGNRSAIHKERERERERMTLAVNFIICLNSETMFKRENYY